MAYSFHYLLFFLGWGYLVSRILGFGRWAYPLALPVSYILLLLNVMFARAFTVPVETLRIALYAQFAACLLWYLGRATKRIGAEYPHGFPRRVNLLNAVAKARIEIGTITVLLLSVGTYLWMVGPYTEVPSDFWTHAGKMQSEYRSLIEAGVFAPSETWLAYLGKDGNWWYAIQAVLMALSGITVPESFAPQALINSMLLLAAYFWFVTRVLQWSSIASRFIYPISALAVVFFIMHHGTNVFAFVRYYTFGPAFLNHAVLFVFLALVLDVLNGRSMKKMASLPVALLMLATMAVIHLQEALFAAVLCYGMLWVLWWQRHAPRGECADQARLDEWFTSRRLSALLLVTTMLLLLGGAYIHLELPRHDPLDYGRLVDIERLLPFLQNLFILDPTRQFYETLTPWGYLVIALFIARFDRFRSNPLLVAGMLSPLLTVFNPLFNDIFLRLSVPWVLWRFLFIMPLAIVAAIMVHDVLKGFRLKAALPVRAGGLVVVLGLSALLFPVDSRFFESPYSKVPTLMPVANGNDYRHWSDLFEYLNGMKASRHIMTDPVTGYMVRALTLHHDQGHKFDTSLSPGYRALVRIPGDDAVYQRYRGSLIILNLRPGEYSRTGGLSRHWRDHQLELTRYYPAALVDFINGNPSRFSKRWESGLIQVFEIV